MKTIDALGLACPKPVILTQKELNANEDVLTRVDNEVARDNLVKLAKFKGYEYETEELEGEYRVTIYGSKKKEEASVERTEKGDNHNLTIAIGSSVMGSGNEELGTILMKSLIFTISESEPLPSTILFFNTGVKLTTKDSPVLSDLKKMEEQGVEILSCGTCLDFLGLKEALEVGEISNMYTIYEKLRDPMRNVTVY